MVKTNVFVGIIIIGLVVLLYAFSTKENSEKWKIFNQNSPDSIPQLFFPGHISTGMGELNSLFTPDDKEFLYSIDLGSMNFVMAFVAIKDNYWSEPQIALFTKIYSGVDPFYANDGNRIYYCSNRPLIQGDNLKDWDIWYVDRTESGWTEPKNLGLPINSNENEFYPCITKNGNMYFQTYKQDSRGSRDIYVSKFVDGKYQEPKNLGDSINSKFSEGDCFVAPDESYVIFSSVNRPDGLGAGDLYISYRINDSIWTGAKHLGSNINSEFHENCPIVSNDGKYFFFTSRKLNNKLRSSDLQYSDLQEFNNMPKNGRGDIYWVDAKIINNLKPTNLDHK